MSTRKLTAPARVMPERQVKEARWEIMLPGYHPVTLNRLLGCHWAIAAKRKKLWMRAIGLFSGHVPKATGKRRVALKVTLAPRQRAFDPDAPWKATLDALVRLGLLVDDNRQGVELGPVTFERGTDKATTIILEDI